MHLEFAVFRGRSRYSPRDINSRNSTQFGDYVIMNLRTDPYSGGIRFSAHAVQRMFERSVGKGDVVEVIRNGEKIADYPDDSPYPTCLILGFVQGRPMHVVLANSSEDDTGIVVTAYEPDSELWDDNFKNRRQ